MRMDALAGALSIKTDEWEEDGLGLARGAWLKLSTGRVVLVYELAHSIDYLGARGPTVEVEAGEATALGLSRLTAEVKSELSLTDKQIIVMYDDAEAWRREAAQAARPRR
jgi:hypothetical protein